MCICVRRESNSNNGTELLLPSKFAINRRSELRAHGHTLASFIIAFPSVCRRVCTDHVVEFF